MQKRAQTVFGMSFGVIFSIIIIIFILAVAIYAINYFLGANNCAKVGLFFSDLQDEIDKAWTSGSYQDKFEGTLPNGIEVLCIGKLFGTDPLDPNYQEIKSDLELQYSGSGEANIFLHPTEKACDGRLFSQILKHVDIQPLNKFSCAPLTDSKIFINLQKGTTDSLVKVTL